MEVSLRRAAQLAASASDSLNLRDLVVTKPGVDLTPVWELTGGRLSGGVCDIIVPRSSIALDKVDHLKDDLLVLVECLSEDRLVAPTASECKTTTHRVKGRGRHWDSDNAEGMMALACLDDSRMWQTYWANLTRQGINACQNILPHTRPPNGRQWATERR